jgi:PAS domain S-box-containing protein
VPQFAAVWCVLVALIVLVVGWGFDVSRVRTVLAGAPYMRVDTAIGLLALGVAFWPNRRWRKGAGIAAGLGALIGVLTLIEYAFGVNLHIDELPMRDRLQPVWGWPAGRMALTTAVSFALLGAGRALSASRRAKSAIEWLAIPAAVLSLVSLIGYLYGVSNIHGVAPYMFMALHTAATFLVVSIALLFGDPHRGAMGILTSGALGGVTARRLLPAAIFIPPLFGWLDRQGQRLGYFDTVCGLSLFATANVMVFAALIWIEARMLNQSDNRRKRAMRHLRASAEEFRALFESTPDATIITDSAGSIVLVNAQAEALFGYAREELVGEPVEKLVPHEARARHVDHRFKFAAAPGTRHFAEASQDVRGLRKNGGIFYADISLNSIRTLDGIRTVCTVRDLTAARTAENALRESEARFRQLADAMPQIVWTATPDGNVDYRNQRGYDYSGLTFDETRDSGWQAMVHPEDRATCLERRAQAFSAGDAYEVEYRLRRASDGIYRWHLGRAIPVRDNDGSIMRWFGTSTDIDNHKRAEQEVRKAWHELKNLNETLEKRVGERTLQLRNSEELFRKLVEGVKDYAILMLDPQGRVTSWTDAAARLMGYASAEIVGTGFSRFYTAADVERGHPEEILRTAARVGHFEEQGWQVRKNGSRFWAEVLITTMRDETGQLRGFSKITRDITERKASEEAIRQSEEKFRAFLESAPDAVVIADGLGRIVLVNAQAERVFGFQRQEMVGQKVEMLIPSAGRLRQGQQTQIYGNPAQAGEMRIGLDLNGLRKNGEEFPIEVSLSPIETAQGSWVAAAIRDIRERKLAERQLVLARQRAEEANHAKSAFLAAMSHEIRTPMNSILGMSDLLSETDLNEAQRQYVRIFQRAGASLLSLINDILDFSKIEAGCFDLEQTVFHLPDLVTQTVELVTPKAHAKEIALVSRIGPGVPNRLTGDATRLRQVLINLLGNAIKFTDTGEVVLTVEEPPAGPAGNVEFLVSDTGIGIPEKQLGTIFEDFQQGDSSTTRKHGGSGLGLAISRRIVERMGGTLSVATEVGKGSTFRFSVPLPPAPEQRKESPVEVPDFHGRRAAIIDFNTTNRLILRESLGSWGLETTEFSSCEEALADLAGGKHDGRCPYAFIVVDSRVDRRTNAGGRPSGGFETAARLRAIFPALPMIMLSSDDHPSDEIRCRESGFLGYAVRPVSRAVLLQLVSKALGCSRSEVTGSAGQPAPKSALAIADMKSLRVLIAEDSPDNRLLVQLYLEGSRHSLTFVEHGEDAVEQFASREFDVVLMDVQMPVMDGLTATRTIRVMELKKGGRAVPILALSANARPEDVASSLEAGCTAHLSKPISKQRLLAALDEYTNAVLV